MSTSTTITLLPQTAFNALTPTIIGTAYNGAGYYHGCNNSHTLSWLISDFVGTITVQATLCDEPESTDCVNDWFDVYAITGIQDTITFLGTSESKYANFTGNYVKLRAKVTGMTKGTIQHLKVTY